MPTGYVLRRKVSTVTRTVEGTAGAAESIARGLSELVTATDQSIFIRQRKAED